MPKPYIDRDGEVGELGQEFFTHAKRGRPALPETSKKRRVNFMLDPEVADRLQEVGNASAFVNSALRKTLGLD